MNIRDYFNFHEKVESILQNVNLYSLSYDLQSGENYPIKRGKLRKFVTENNNKFLNNEYDFDDYRINDSNYLIISKDDDKLINISLNSIFEKSDNPLLTQLHLKDVLQNLTLRHLISKLFCIC